MDQTRSQTAITIASGVARAFQLQGHCSLRGLSGQKPPRQLSGSPAATERPKLPASEARKFSSFPSLFSPFSFLFLPFSSLLFPLLFLFCLALCSACRLISQVAFNHRHVRSSFEFEASLLLVRLVRDICNRVSHYEIEQLLTIISTSLIANTV